MPKGRHKTKGFCSLCGKWKQDVEYCGSDETGEYWMCQSCKVDDFDGGPVGVKFWIVFAIFVIIGIIAIALGLPM